MQMANISMPSVAAMVKVFWFIYQKPRDISNLRPIKEIQMVSWSMEVVVIMGEGFRLIFMRQ
jgi:hypothetical protein